MAVMIGLVFLISRRSYGTPEKLQKIVGFMLILISVHLLFLNYDSFFGEVANIFLQYVLVLFDLGFFIYCIIFLSRTLHRHDSSRTVTHAADPAGEAAAGEIPSEPETTIPEQEPESEPENEDDQEAVEQLENPNVDDFLFFQKVEALMVNELLFCEQDLSREALATAIGTNRTYLARSIKSSTGKTFSEYITDLRTAYAAKLLTTTDEPLDLIGTLVGFRSKSSYYRAFSAAFNCSPSEYRRNSVCLRTLEKE